MGEKRCINCMKLLTGGDEICPHCGYNQKIEQSRFCMKPNSILAGRYLTGRLLGQGGFGMTYVGYDLRLESKVAIKEYFPMGNATRDSATNKIEWNTSRFDSTEWQKGCDSFLKEARRMEKLNSFPNIVRVRDTFTANGTAYIIMEYIEGETLKQHLVKSGTLTYEECIALLKPLMESLAKMHQMGLIHRDISPDNIMIREDGMACLLDFGAAKDISFQQNAASQQITKKGFSPLEQYQEGGSIGPWTDVYALCATMYYCITGKLIPDAMDRIGSDKLKFSPDFEAFVGVQAATAMAEGLSVLPDGRIQSVDILLDRLPEKKKTINTDENNADCNKIKDHNDSNNRDDGNGMIKKKTGIIAVAAAAVLLAGAGIYALTHGTDNAPHADTAAAVDITTEENSETVLSVLSSESEPERKPDAASTEKSGLSNILMRDDNFEKQEDGYYKGTVLGSNLMRDSVVSVTFLDTLEDMPDTAWDVSWTHDGGVMAWTNQVENGNTYDLYIGADGGITARDCYGLFLGYSNVQSIEFNDCFDTSNVSNMHSMFQDCASLTNLDLSCFDTSKVEDMGWMFWRCTNLQRVETGSFNTGNVESMRSMFNECENLSEIDVSGFDTSKVNSMLATFRKCEKLLELDVSNFSTANVTTMRAMFQGCKNVTRLDVSNFDTAKVTDMGYLFAACEMLTELDVSGFDTGNAINMRAMFSECKNLKNIDLNSFDTGKVTDMGYMFYSCGGLEELDLRNMNTASVIDMEGMLSGLTVSGLDLTNFDTGNVANMVGMFENSVNLTALDLKSFNTDSLTEIHGMFRGCGGLEELDLSSFNTANVTEFYNLFYLCESLETVDLSSFDTGNATNMSGMFRDCRSLTSLDLSNFAVNEGTDTTDMFTNCSVTAEEAGLKIH